jgi:hypothetical protein
MTRGGSPAWGLGMGLKKTLNQKKKNYVMNSLQEPWTRTDSLDKLPKIRNMSMRFGTWIVINLYREGSLVIVVDSDIKSTIEI